MPNEAFRYELLDVRDAVLGRLDGVQSGGGSLTFSVSADIRGSGSIDYAGQGHDWLRRRLRISMLQDETVTPLITALVSVPDETYTDTGYAAQLDLYDKTAILHGDNFGGTYAVPAGANIIDAVVEVIASSGETRISIDPSEVTLITGLVWDANTTKLRIVNDLLTAANYFTIWADGLGYLRSTPYLAPDQRPAQATYNDDGTGLYLPGFSRSYDLTSVPNRFRVVAKTDGETEALTATAEIDDGRGYWLTRTQTDVDHAGNLDQIAARKLADARQIAETFQVTHPLNKSRCNDLVEFTNRNAGARRAVVQKQVYRLKAGGLITSTLRAVI